MQSALLTVMPSVPVPLESESRMAAARSTTASGRLEGHITRSRAAWQLSKSTRLSTNRNSRSSWGAFTSPRSGPVFCWFRKCQPSAGSLPFDLPRAPDAGQAADRGEQKAGHREHRRMPQARQQSSESPSDERSDPDQPTRRHAPSSCSAGSGSRPAGPGPSIMEGFSARVRRRLSPQSAPGRRHRRSWTPGPYFPTLGANRHDTLRHLRL